MFYYTRVKNVYRLFLFISALFNKNCKFGLLFTPPENFLQFIRIAARPSPVEGKGAERAYHNKIPYPHREFLSGKRFKEISPARKCEIENNTAERVLLRHSGGTIHSGIGVRFKGKYAIFIFQFIHSFIREFQFSLCIGHN